MNDFHAGILKVFLLLRKQVRRNGGNKIRIRLHIIDILNTRMFEYFFQESGNPTTQDKDRAGILMLKKR